MPKELYEKLQHWQIDDIDTTFPFSKRLARDNGWTHTYAKRVVDEYKKFVCLAIHAGHPVTPSDQVDQAWHLHLTYTKSYWEDMCEGILQQKLHHHPTKGGKTENNKFNDWYSRTLVSYQQLFGIVPPADIWPAPHLRFGEAPFFKRINTSNVWMIPKPKLSAGIVSALLICILSGILAGCSGNPVATGIFVFAAITSLIIVAIVWIVKASKKSSAGKNKPSDSNTVNSDSGSHSSDFSSGAAATGAAVGFAGFGGGNFGGSGAGGDYAGDSNSSDSAGDSSSSDGGGDSGGSGCSSGCGVGGD